MALADTIKYLINLSIRYSVVPQTWKQATVTPIFKGGDKQSTNNYRPISLLSVVSKVLEKWVVNQLIDHLNTGDTSLHPMQFGFRERHSTESAITMLMEKVKGSLENTTYVGAVFLDLKKAFDVVNHSVLLTKLQKFNFSEPVLKWMTSYLSNRKQATMVNGKRSSYLHCPLGVPQGSILGPVLFSLFINDLPDVCKGVDIQLYADDTVIFTSAKTSEEAAQVLTSALTTIKSWLISSCLQLNTQKTVCMFFSKRAINIARSNVYFGDQELQLVNEVKYLGVLLDSTLSFKKHVKMISRIIKYNVANFNQIRRSMTDQAAMMYLHCMIFSHIGYCITTWSLTGVTILKPIERLYKRALKILDKKTN